MPLFLFSPDAFMLSLHAVAYTVAAESAKIRHSCPLVYETGCEYTCYMHVCKHNLIV